MDQDTKSAEPNYSEIDAKLSAKDLVSRMAMEKDLSNRYGMLVNQSYKSDVQFIFVEAEETTTLYAHKSILITGSPVFDAMFNNGKWKENESFEIVDISSETFKEILNYVYAHKTCNLTESNATEMMYAARKYEIITLEEIICDFLITKITTENVCRFYEANYLLGNKLAAKCEQLIKNETQSILVTDAFLSLSIDTLQNILSFDEMDVEEHELFRGLINWAESACVKAEMANTLENKRDLLKDAVKLIRFPIMTMDNFIKCSTNLSSFFTREEMGAIYFAINEPEYVGNHLLPYSSAKRSKKIEADDFTWILDRTGLVRGDRDMCCELISIKPNQTVKLNTIHIATVSEENYIGVELYKFQKEKSTLLIEKGAKKNCCIQIDKILKPNETFFIRICYNTLFHLIYPTCENIRIQRIIESSDITFRIIISNKTTLEKIDFSQVY